MTDNTQDPASGMYDRLSFHLTYGYAPDRTIGPGAILGPDIPNAYNPTGPYSPGEWDLGDQALATDAPDEEVLRVAFTSALNEAAHEALEWFRLDGKPLLDPHGLSSDAIHDVTQRMGEELLALALSEPDARERVARTGEEQDSA